MKPKISWNRQRSSIFLTNIYADGFTQKNSELVARKGADCITGKQLVSSLDDGRLLTYKEAKRCIHCGNTEYWASEMEEWDDESIRR